MTFKNIVKFVVTSFCALLVTGSCSSRTVYHAPGPRVGHGPPAHAPAHGYRHKYVGGVELVFDTSLGLYVVVGYPAHYYCDGHFYRFTGGVWETSAKFDSGWIVTTGKPLPPGLRGIHGKGNGSGKVKSQGKVVARGKGKHKGR